MEAQSRGVTPATDLQRGRKKSPPALPSNADGWIHPKNESEESPMRERVTTFAKE